MEKEFLEELVGQQAAQQILERHRQELAALQATCALSLAVQRAGGRSEKAIRALVDETAIAAAEDMQAAADAAVEAVRRENGFLFAPPQVSSPGTGAMTVSARPTPDDIAKMSLAEYRRYRQGR